MISYEKGNYFTDKGNFLRIAKKIRPCQGWIFFKYPGEIGIEFKIETGQGTEESQYLPYTFFYG